MKKFWRYISYLGIEGDRSMLSQRALILNNQFNFAMLAIMLAILIFLSIMRSIEGTTIGMGSLRLLFVLLLNFINLILAYFRKNQLSKFLLIFLPPVLIYIIPTLTGFVEQESFAYYPLSIIVMSLIPQILLVLNEEKIILIVALLFYGSLILFIEPFLFLFSPPTFTIIPIVKGFLIYSKAVQIVTFLLLQFALFYLRRINWQFEQKILEKNIVLDKQNAELNKTIRNLHETQQQLYQAEKMTALGTLTAGVAHEINNPLNFISGGLSMLKERWDNYKTAISTDIYNDFESAIKMIGEGADRTSRIVTALISITGSGLQEKELCDVNEILDNTVMFMNYKVPRRTIILKDYRLAEHIPLVKAHFQQAVLNIIENAINAIESSPENRPSYIKLSTFLGHTGEKNTVATIKISNSGLPIPDDKIKNIFEPFFTTKDAGKGTGLGLTVAYMFIKAHQGNITVENTFDGVSFTITLPIH